MWGHSNRQEPLIDLKDQNITVSKKSKNLKSIKEVKTFDIKDSAKNTTPSDITQLKIKPYLTDTKQC